MKQLVERSGEAEPDVAEDRRPAARIKRILAVFQARNIHSGPIAIGFGLALVTWSVTRTALKPSDIIDFDYIGALQWAAIHRVPFGSHFVFTYGPLGFLSWPTLFFGTTAAAGFLFLTVLKTAVGAVLYSSLRVSMAAVPAALIAYVVVSVIGVSIEFLVPLGLVWAFRLTRLGGGGNKKALIEFAAAGSFVAIAELIKVSFGPPLLVIFTAAWLLRSGRQASEAYAFLSGLAFTFIVLWLATGNDLFAVFSWLKLSANMVAGYSAMAYEIPGRLYFYGLAAVGVLAVLGLTLAGLPRRSPLRVIGYVLMPLVALDQVFRESFVRHDAHDFFFFAELPLFFAAALAGTTLLSVRGVQPTAMVCGAVLVLVVTGTVPTTVGRPATGAHNWLAAAHAIVSGSERTRLQTEARAGLQQIYRLPDQWLTELRGQRVAVVPRGQPMAWTYPQLSWAPLPTIQGYQAYTPALDNLDARFLSQRNGPRWLLWQSFGLDNRDPLWDSPAAELAVRCNYSPVGSSKWMTLLRKTSPRCGKPRMLYTVTAPLEATVRARSAPPGTALVAQIETGPSMAGRVASLLFKGATYSVMINGTTNYRFVPGTGASLHVLSFPSDSPDELQAPTVTSLKVISNDTWASSSTLTVRFFAIPVSRDN